MGIFFAHGREPLAGFGAREIRQRAFGFKRQSGFSLQVVGILYPEAVYLRVGRRAVWDKLAGKKSDSLAKGPIIMIITRTPFRISFFGGGTDFPAWYRTYGGAVLSSTIDKYCYIFARHLPPFFEHKSRIVWSKIENVKDADEIFHPSVRETLKFLDMKDGVEIHHHGDVPARGGLGSSSAFTVGLLNALYALRGEEASKIKLAEEAIHIEQNLIKENVGSQDQTAAAFGGFNRIEFNKEGKIMASPIQMDSQKSDFFQKHLMLFFTGLTRNSSEVAAEQVKNIPKKRRELELMKSITNEAHSILIAKQDNLREFGKLLHKNWLIKRSLSSQISNPAIDDAYGAAVAGGALGGKILGAGGGGFLLFFAEPEAHAKIRENLKNLLYVPFRFENAGSHVIFKENHA